MQMASAATVRYSPQPVPGTVSMIAASSSFLRSCVKTKPLPALKLGSSSSTVIAAVTASSVGLPALSRA